MFSVTFILHNVYMLLSRCYSDTSSSSAALATLPCLVFLQTFAVLFAVSPCLPQLLSTIILPQSPALGALPLSPKHPLPPGPVADLRRGKARREYKQRGAMSGAIFLGVSGVYSIILMVITCGGHHLMLPG